MFMKEFGQWLRHKIRVIIIKQWKKPMRIYTNLMRTFVAGFAFIMPFSLVHQMVRDRLGRKNTGWKKKMPSVTGFLAGIAVSVAGNMHYVIYGCVIPWIQKAKGEEVGHYWFPDATRYIGFNPDVFVPFQEYILYECSPCILQSHGNV